MQAVKALLATDLRPMVIWVPRAPEKFDDTAAFLSDHGLACLRRSEAFDADMKVKTELAGVDVILGDSMGEMNAYLAPADAVIVGGGFRKSGTHNVIEPLVLGKPVVTGPEVWTIEFPAVEAEAAGVMIICPDPSKLAEVVSHAMELGSGPAEEFHAAYAGASNRIYEAIQPLLERDC